MNRFVKKKRKNKKIIRFNRLGIVMLIGILSVPLVRVTYAKYMQNKDKSAIYSGSDFYFESDLLLDSREVPTYTYAEGENSIKINLRNYIDDLRYSEVEIDYEVYLTDTAGNPVRDKSGNTISNRTGKLGKNSKSDVNIEFNNLKVGSYILKANAIRPYSKEIKAKFNIMSNEDNIEYSVSDQEGSAVLKLTVSSKGYSGNLTLSWPNNVSPDSTDGYFAAVNTGSTASSQVVSFNANSEYTFHM